MWTLEMPPIDNVGAQLERALSRDRGTPPYSLTAAECAAIVARYKMYDVTGGRASPSLKNPTGTLALSDAIHDAYDQVQSGKRLEALREDLKSGARLCPYCSAPTITDLDHYLPRSLYKDFAIYPRNLVPSCHPCNNIKRTFDPEVDAERLIHPYFDKLPKVAFLMAHVEISSNGGLMVEFTVDMSSDPDQELLKRAHFQIEKFKLNERSRTTINVFLASFEASFELAFNPGGAYGVSKFLEMTAASHTRNFGLNDWRVALLSALATNKAFCAGGFQEVLGKVDLGKGLS